MNIVLIGYRGTGKSSVAGILADRLGWKHISTDAEIIVRAKQSIPDIVKAFGWDYFRNLENTKYQVFWSDLEDLVNSPKEKKSNASGKHSPR